MVGLSLREGVITDCEVQFVGVEIIQEGRKVEIVEPHMDTRRDLAQAREESRNDQDFHTVGQSEPDSSHRCCWVECFVARHERLDLSQRGPRGIKVMARGVRRMPSGPRVRSSSLNSSRRRARLWLIADWLMPTRVAARVTLRSVSSASR
jgi:hypothetical protein